MKYGFLMTAAAAVLAGSVFVGCDSKAKEEQKQASQPANAADAQAMAQKQQKVAADDGKVNGAMQKLGESTSATTQKAGDMAHNMGTAISGETQKMTDKMPTSMPSMGH